MGIANLSAGSAQNYYYEKDPIFNSDAKGENLTWGGNAAKSLGLAGNVDQKDFEGALNGNVKGIELRNMNQKTSGENRDAYDLVLSAPKSVSHAALVLGDKAVEKAHDDAVKAAMDKAEHSAQTRVYKNGQRTKENTGNLLYAQAKHSTSRSAEGQAPDPSLHTHNVIMNTTQGKDGSWKSLSNEELFRQQNLINTIYKQELAANLKEAGYGLSFDKKSNFEISGYSKDIIDNFSKRSKEIDKQVDEMRKDPKFADKSEKELRDYAQHNYKSDKQEISAKDLKNDWKSQHENKNITSLKDLKKEVDSFKNQDNDKLSVKDVLRIAGEKLSDKESHFSKNDLLKEALRVNEGDNKVSAIEKELDSIKKIGQKEGSDLKKIEVNGETRYTTKEVYDAEKENVKILSENTKGEALLTKEEANRGIADFEDKMGWKMTDTQREAAFNALTSKDQFTSIQGDAGTGKTTMLDAVRHSLEYNHKNSNQLGVLAPTGKAASGAEQESGIKGMTVDKYLISGGFGGKDQTPSLADKEGVNNSFKGYSKDFRQAFATENKMKMAMDMTKTKNGDLIGRVSTKGYEKTINTYKHKTKERVMSGEFKGSTRTTEFIAKGDTLINKQTTKMNDGRKMEFAAEEWNPLKKMKMDIISTKKMTSKTYDENGKLEYSSARTQYTFLGKTFGKETKAQDGKTENRNFTKDDKGKTIFSKSESKENDQKLEKIDKQLDKKVNEYQKKAGSKTIFVDESSMLSSKKLNSILKDANENGHKVVFIGDTKQLQSVQQGQSFNELQSLTKTTHMNEGMRQRSADAETKHVVNSFAKKDVTTAMNTLDQQGKFKEMDSKDRVDFISTKLAEKNGFKDTIALATSKAEVKEINEATREKIFGDKDAGTKSTVLVDKSLDQVQKMKSDNYEKGDKVSIKMKTTSGKDRFSTYEVKGIDKDKNQIFLASDKKSFTLDLRKESHNITNVEKKEERSFAEGDKVIALKNDNQGGAKNGQVGYVTEIDNHNGTMNVKFEDKTVSYDLKKENNIDHAYAMTVHKSQGVTEKNAIASFDTKNSGMNNQNLAYVAASRHKENLTVLTDNKEKLVDQIKVEQHKTSTTDSKESKQDLAAELKKDSNQSNDKESKNKNSENGKEPSKEKLDLAAELKKDSNQSNDKESKNDAKDKAESKETEFIR